MENSYRALETPGIQPRIMYQKDFTDGGQFSEETADNEINLMCSVWPGIWNGKEWEEVVSTDDESCAIHLYYYNQNNIEVIIDSAYGRGKHLKPAFDFLKKTAKEFFLVSEYVQRQKGANPVLGMSIPLLLEWEDIEKMLAEGKRQEGPYAGNSWFKTMTVAKAKELFDFLKIKVNFPS